MFETEISAQRSVMTHLFMYRQAILGWQEAWKKWGAVAWHHQSLHPQADQLILVSIIRLQGIVPNRCHFCKKRNWIKSKYRWNTSCLRAMITKWMQEVTYIICCDLRWHKYIYDIIVYNCIYIIYTHLLPDTWGVFIGFGLGHEDMRWTPPRRSKMLPPTSRVSALCCWTCQQFRVPNTYDIEVRTPQLDPKT